MDGNEDDKKAVFALEAIRGDLTLAELAAKHGVHHTMIAAWKRQAVDGMATTFSGAGEATKSTSRPSWKICTPRKTVGFWRHGCVTDRRGVTGLAWLPVPG